MLITPMPLKSLEICTGADGAVAGLVIFSRKPLSEYPRYSDPSLNGILDGTGSRKGTTLQTVALPTGPFNDGSLYLGYSDSGFLEKITNPARSEERRGG